MNCMILYPDLFQKKKEERMKRVKKNANSMNL